MLSEPEFADAGDLVHWGLTPTVYRQRNGRRSRAEGRVIDWRPYQGRHRHASGGCRAWRLADIVDEIEAHAHLRSRPSGPTLRSPRRTTDLRPNRSSSSIEPLFRCDRPWFIWPTPPVASSIPELAGTWSGLVSASTASTLVRRRKAHRSATRAANRFAGCLRERLAAGDRPSYGRRRPLADDHYVATVPIGYADGVPRVLSDEGEVLIGGPRQPLAGTVTMDQIVVDVGPEPVDVGAEVVLIGHKAMIR